MNVLSPTKEEIKLSSAISNVSTLSEIVLTRCSVSGDRRVALVQPFNMSCSVVSTKADVEDDRLTIEIDFEFRSLDASVPGKIVVLVECTFGLTYRLADGFVPEQPSIDAFSKGNAVYNCWPYLREFVQSIAARMGHSPPPVPLLRVQPQKAAEPKATGES